MSVGLSDRNEPGAYSPIFKALVTEATTGGAFQVIGSNTREPSAAMICTLVVKATDGPWANGVVPTTTPAESTWPGTSISSDPPLLKRSSPAAAPLVLKRTATAVPAG